VMLLRRLFTKNDMHSDLVVVLATT
jgi:hypothetical protein